MTRLALSPTSPWLKAIHQGNCLALETVRTYVGVTYDVVPRRLALKRPLTSRFKCGSDGRAGYCKDLRC
ncbi:unnamed protein product [Nezara viridula]|uniref:Uncharacterized protein n=1 Tax=Nezara viridula TaxID=85310 RepID=A0A9P0EH65_NEZVI|nr:unnamed protein product [Nezara viridula]